MKTYDYTENSDISGFVYDEIGKMRPYELVKVSEAIQNFRREEQMKREEAVAEWFHMAIVPILQEAVESFAGVLEINDDDDDEIVATISAEGGFELFIHESRMRMVLFLADSISTEIMDGKIELALIFDREYLMK